MNDDQEIPSFFSLEDTLKEEQTKNIDRMKESPKRIDLNFELSLESNFALKRYFFEIDKVENLEQLKDLTKSLVESFIVQKQLITHIFKQK